MPTSRPSRPRPPSTPATARVIRLRTFSKAYGMAGLRVGYAMGDAELIAAFDKVRNHFGVGRIAQAGALAALEDRAWLDEVCAQDGRRPRRGIARDRRARPAWSRCPRPPTSSPSTAAATARFARRVVAALAARDVFVRMPFAAAAEPLHPRRLRHRRQTSIFWPRSLPDGAARGKAWRRLRCGGNARASAGVLLVPDTTPLLDACHA